MTEQWTRQHPIEAVMDEPPTNIYDLTAEGNPIAQNQISIPQIRLDFIRRVFAILTIPKYLNIVQLFLALVMIVVSVFIEAYRQFQVQNMWILYGSAGLMALCITVSIIPWINSKIPNNVAILVIFTLCQAYVCSFACSIISSRYIVLLAASEIFGIMINHIGLIAMAAVYTSVTKQWNKKWCCLGVIVISLICLAISLPLLISTQMIPTLCCWAITLFITLSLIWTIQFSMDNQCLPLNMSDPQGSAMCLYVELIVMTVLGLLIMFMALNTGSGNQDETANQV